MSTHDKPMTRGTRASRPRKVSARTEPLVSANRIFLLLCSLCAFFSAFSFILRAVFNSGVDFVGLTSLLNLFDIDRENSIPTWYSSQILFLCAAVLYLIFVRERESRRPYTRYWLGLAIVFFTFSVDETVAFHEEIVGVFLSRAFHLSGVLYYGWVVPAAVLLVFFGALYMRFFWNLPPRTRLLFLLAALLYVGGALGMELVGGYYADLNGTQHLAYAGITSIEEGMEMLGAVLFLYALVSHKKREALFLHR